MHKGMIAVLMALAVGAAACGKADSASPAGPSSSATPAPSSGPTNGSANISGMVLTGSSTAAFRPAGGSLTVTIVGTSISATIDGSGHFTLRNVPSGDLMLAFSGSGHDALVSITGVEDLEQIRITVNLGSNSANIDDNERERP